MIRERPNLRDKSMESSKEMSEENLTGEDENKMSDSMERYKDSLEKKNLLEKHVEESKSQLKKDYNKISELRKSLGLPSDNKLETAMSDYLNSLDQQQKEIEQKNKEDELTLLDAPEGEPEDLELFSENMEDVTEDRERLNEMEKEAREKFVQKFIDSSIEKVIDAFRQHLDESENTEQAEGLISEKISLEVLDQASDFIEKGGTQGGKVGGFGFRAELEISEFPDADGEKVKHVTGFNLNFETGQISSLRSKNKEVEGDKLVDEETEDAMKSAEQEGELTETKKKK